MPLEIDKRAADGTSVSIGHNDKLLTHLDEMTDQLARSRRQVVFRPSASEPLANGEQATVEILMVDGSGTTSRIDSSSRVAVTINAGTGTIITSQPVTFKNGSAKVTVRKDGVGTLTLGFANLVVEGPQETGVVIDTSATKDLT